MNYWVFYPNVCGGNEVMQSLGRIYGQWKKIDNMKQSGQITLYSAPIIVSCLLLPCKIVPCFAIVQMAHNPQTNLCDIYIYICITLYWNRMNQIGPKFVSVNHEYWSRIFVFHHCPVLISNQETLSYVRKTCMKNYLTSFSMHTRWLYAKIKR